MHLIAVSRTELDPNYKGPLGHREAQSLAACMASRDLPARGRMKCPNKILKRPFFTGILSNTCRAHPQTI